MTEESYTVDLAESKFLDSSYIIPKIKELAGKEFVNWGDGYKNNYPDKLISLVNNSALHNAIVVNKAMQIAGNGIEFDKTTALNQATTEFLSDINDKGEDINEVVAKMAFDYTLFNGFALIIRWSKDWSRINSVEHVEFNKIRTGKVDAMGKVNGYWYSFDWDCYRPSRIYIPAFNSNMASQKKKDYAEAIEAFKENNKAVNQEILKDMDTTQILVFKPYRPDSFYYPVPSYAGAIASIEADIESDNYALSSLKNALAIEYIVKFPKTGTNETQTSVAKKFIGSFTGAKKQGMPLLTFKNAEGEGVEIETLESADSHQKYSVINESNLQKILAGHRVTHPSLVGILTAGKLGGSSDIEHAQKVFYNTVINPDQLAITKNLNKIMKVNGLELVSIDSNNPFETVEEKTEENNNEIEVKE